MNNRSAWIISRLALVPCLLALLATGTLIAPQARAAEPPASPLMAGTDELACGFKQPPESARTGIFWFWINGNITREGITAGCGDGIYCPEAAVTRDQMAVFLVRTFGL